MTGGALALLLGEGRDTFLCERWGQRSTPLPGHRERFRPLFDHAAFVSQLERRDVVVSAVLPGPEGESPEHQRIPSRLAESLFRAGRTVSIDGVERHCPPLLAFARRFKIELGFAGPVLVNAYSSPDGCGFPMHLDDQHVFLMQIEGQKRWRFSEIPAWSEPARNLVAADQESYQRRCPWTEIAPPGSLGEVVLSPGDALYLPPGVWHCGEAVGGSLALSLTLPPAPLHRWLVERLTRQEWARRGWPLAHQGPDEVRARIDELRRRLVELASSLDPEDAVDDWLRAQGEPGACGGAVPEGARQTVTSSPVSRVTRGDRVIVSHAGLRLALPEIARPWLGRALGGEVFTAATAARWPEGESLDPPVLAHFLRELGKLGALVEVVP